jgi:hypothetical protein
MSNVQSAFEFEVGDRAFKLKPLKLEPQMEGLALVTEALLPAFVAFGNGANMRPSDVAEALRGVQKLPQFVKLFVEQTEVKWSNDQFVPLKNFQDLVFARRPDLLVGYVAECVWSEYSAFLNESGKAILAKAGSRFNFLTA